jgi:ABC-type Na+ transport system ATPase subunit NatA
VIIQTDNIWKKYGRFDALRGLSIAVPEGSTFALIGANGAGKSTTIKLLMNIIAPSQGSATILGVDSCKILPKELAQIGYVSENQKMPGRLTVAEFVAYLRPFYLSWDRELEADILVQLRLPPDRKIKNLSHGMRLKMALACALPFRPKLLVLDEPFSGLDPLVRDEFMENLLRQAGDGMTILISSHQLMELRRRHPCGLSGPRQAAVSGTHERSDRSLAGGACRIGACRPRADTDAERVARLSRFRQCRQLCRYRLFRGQSGGKRRRRFRQRARDRRAAHRIALHLQDPGPGDPRGGRGIMIWHIFKKDWKLLWPFVLIIAAVEFVDTAAWLMFGHFYESPTLIQIIGPLRWAMLLGIAALITMAVHQDMVPGDRQDWLVRPVHRRDLLLEKILFVLVAVHGPLVLADLAHGMATGFPLWGSLSLALSHGVYLLLVFSLPMLGIAAMTSTIVEAVGVALAIILVFAILLAFGHGAPLSYDSNLSWMDFTFWSVVALVAAALIIPLQYFRRATALARGVVLGAVLLLPLPGFVSWAPAFAFQKLLSADPAAAQPVKVAFDPGLGRSAVAPGGQDRANSVWLPLRVQGLAPESIVISDRANVRIIGRDGSIIFSGRATGDPQVTGDPGDGSYHSDDFPVRTTSGGEVRTHELITLPGRIYDLVRSQQVRMELDYSLTLFRMEASDAIAALNGDKRMTHIGWCKTKLDYNGNFVNLGCIKLGGGNAPTCSTLVLENTTSGQKNPASSRCSANYAPYTAYGIFPVMWPNVYRQAVRDPQGLAKYPVDGSQLANAQVFIKTYRPVAHFTRHLVIPQIRLDDWAAQIATPSP